MDNQQAKEQRVREYIISQAERFDFIELWTRNIKARLDLLDSLRNLSEAQATFKPSATDWSISEVASHILEGSKRVAFIVRSLSAGKLESFDNIDPPRTEVPHPITALQRELLHDAVNWSSLTQTFPETPCLEFTAKHPFFGELNSRGWYLFQRLHDLDHYQQIEAIKLSSGYPEIEAN